MIRLVKLEDYNEREAKFNDWLVETDDSAPIMIVLATDGHSDYLLHWYDGYSTELFHSLDDAIKRCNESVSDAWPDEKFEG